MTEIVLASMIVIASNTILGYLWGRWEGANKPWSSPAQFLIMYLIAMTLGTLALLVLLK